MEFHDDDFDLGQAVPTVGPGWNRNEAMAMYEDGGFWALVGELMFAGVVLASFVVILWVFYALV